jgi:hypothetical protein
MFAQTDKLTDIAEEVRLSERIQLFRDFGFHFYLLHSNEIFQLTVKNLHRSFEKFNIDPFGYGGNGERGGIIDESY